MLSRRDVVGRLAAGAAAVCVAGVARASVGSGRSVDSLRGDGDPCTDAEGPLNANAPATAPGLEGGLQVVDAGVPATLSAPAPWRLLQPLAVGAALATGWRVAGLTGVVDGSCVLTLQNERGRAHRVHLCRNDDRPRGLVYTKRLDLVVMNGGQGDLPTDEGFAQAVAEVSHVLATNEGDAQHESVIAALLPHAERVERFASTAQLR